jgi:hypothetical protein
VQECQEGVLLESLFTERLHECENFSSLLPCDPRICEDLYATQARQKWNLCSLDWSDFSIKPPPSRDEVHVFAFLTCECHLRFRFNVRGINDDGHVANFVETEQILGMNSRAFFFTFLFFSFLAIDS